MPKSPAFQWYPKDCDTDEVVIMMTLEEFGAYVRLLNYQWTNESVPSDPDLIARILRVDSSTVDRIWPAVGQKFKPKRRDGSRLFNERLERERKSQLARQKRLREAALKRWKSSPTTSVDRKNANESHVLASESASKKSKKINSKDTDLSSVKHEKQNTKDAKALHEMQRSSSSSSSASSSANCSYIRQEKKKLTADERREPLLKFFAEEYLESRGVALVTDQSDYVAVSSTLSKTRGDPKFTLDYLQESARIFLRSRDPFHLQQAHPLRFWANGINGFIPGVTDANQQATTTRSRQGLARGPAYTPKQQR